MAKGDIADKVADAVIELQSALVARLRVHRETPWGTDQVTALQEASGRIERARLALDRALVEAANEREHTS